MTQQKRELKANLFNELKCKNSPQNTSKPNSTTYQKDHTLQPSWFHFRDEKRI
jgi:hypothetical protein